MWAMASSSSEKVDSLMIRFRIEGIRKVKLKRCTKNIGTVKQVCIVLSPGHEYVTESGIVSHNSKTSPAYSPRKPLADLHEEDIVYGAPRRSASQRINSSQALLDSYNLIGGDKPSMWSNFQAFMKDWRKNLADVSERIKDQFYFGVFNRMRGIEKVENRLTRLIGNQTGQVFRDDLLGAEMSAYKLAVMGTDAVGLASEWLEAGVPTWDNTGDLVKLAGSKPITQVFEDIKKKGGQAAVEEFKLYLVGRRAQELKAQNKEHLFDDAKINAMLGLGTKEFEGAAKDYYEYQKGVLDFAVQSGLVTPELRTHLQQMHQNYVPFYRLIDPAANDVHGPISKQTIQGQTSGIRAIKGGTQNIGQLFENMERNLLHLMAASMRNVAMIRLNAQSEMLTSMGESAPLEKMRSGQVAQVGIESIKTDLRKMGADPVLVGQLPATGLRALWDVAHTKEAKDVVTFKSGGKTVHRRVVDPLLMQGLMALKAGPVTDQLLGQRLGKIARAPRQIYQRLVTLAPQFIAGNAFRDAMMGWIANPEMRLPLLNQLEGLSAYLRKDPDLQEIMLAGGSDPNAWRRSHGLTDSKSRLTQVTEGTPSSIPAALYNSSLGPVVKFLEKMGASAEIANRAAVAMEARKAGASRLEAAYRFRQASTDFSLRGGWPAILFLSETAPFFNAAVQSMGRTGKAIQEDPAGIAIKGAGLAMASALLAMRNHDEEEYRRLPEWEKNHNWILFFDTQWGKLKIKIPKPFEAGTIFGSIPERITSAVMDSLEGRLSTAEYEAHVEQMMGQILQTFSIGIVPQAVGPIIEQLANYDWFRQRDIVPASLESASPEAQFDPRSTPLSLRMLGQATGTSPLRLQHLLNSYFGTLGAMTAVGADQLIHALSGKSIPVEPTWRVEQYPVVGKFFGLADGTRTKFSQEFYDLAGRSERIVRDMKTWAEISDLAMVRDAVEKLKGLNRPDAPRIGIEKSVVTKTQEITRGLGLDGKDLKPIIRKALQIEKELNGLEKSLQDFRKKEIEIYDSMKLSADEKRAQLDAIARKKTVIYKKGVDLGRQMFYAK